MYFIFMFIDQRSLDIGKTLQNYRKIICKKYTWIMMYVAVITKSGEAIHSARTMFEGVTNKSANINGKTLEKKRKSLYPLCLCSSWATGHFKKKSTHIEYLLSSQNRNEKKRRILLLWWKLCASKWKKNK